MPKTDMTQKEYIDMKRHSYRLNRSFQTGIFAVAVAFWTITCGGTSEKSSPILGKDYYPYKVFLFYFNPNLRSAHWLNDGRFGIDEGTSHFSYADNILEITRSDKKKRKYIIEFEDDRIMAEMYDSYGLWQTYDIRYINGRLDYYNWASRFITESLEEPEMIDEENFFEYSEDGSLRIHQMIDEENFFEYNEDGSLRLHRRPSEYRYREYFYDEEGRLTMIQNFLGNGETVKKVSDHFIYQDENTYVVEPCSELSFYSMHFPIMDRKEHTSVMASGKEVITDTYYHDDQIYWETVSEWDGENILSWRLYSNDSYENVVTHTFKYR